MDRWRGKVAIVTGASAGIGKATMKVLAEKGMIVIGLARRKDQIEENMRGFQGPGKFHALQCDITNKEEVLNSMNWVKKKYSFVDVLVNNAGMVKHISTAEASMEDLEQIINLNIKGLIYCSKQFIDMFQKSEVKRESHIININSVLGHMQPVDLVTNIYPATKYAVRAFSDTLRNELHNTKIRVTNLSPGLVRTDMMEAAQKKNKDLVHAPALKPEDLADAVVYVLGSPPHVEINELIIQAKPT